MTGSERVHKLIGLASDIAAGENDAESIGFLGQALVQTTLPHSDPGVPYFERSSGAVSLSIIANPKVTEGRKTWRVAKNSPALKLGFKPWDWSKCGPRPKGKRG